jgi:predicted DNA-binding transcriptional regulator AlpA
MIRDPRAPIEGPGQWPDLEQLPIDRIPAAIAFLAARLAQAPPLPGTNESPQPKNDTLLPIDEAAVRLGVSTDWLYRRADGLPFTVRLGRNLRFSSQEIANYIRQRRGRTATNGS